MGEPSTAESPHRYGIDAEPRTCPAHQHRSTPKQHPGAEEEEGPASAIIPRLGFAPRSSGGGEEKTTALDARDQIGRGGQEGGDREERGGGGSRREEIKSPKLK